METIYTDVAITITVNTSQSPSEWRSHFLSALSPFLSSSSLSWWSSPPPLQGQPSPPSAEAPHDPPEWSPPLHRWQPIPICTIVMAIIIIFITIIVKDQQHLTIPVKVVSPSSPMATNSHLHHHHHHGHYHCHDRHHRQWPAAPHDPRQSGLPLFTDGNQRSTTVTLATVFACSNNCLPVFDI